MGYILALGKNANGQSWVTIILDEISTGTLQEFRWAH